LTFREKNRLKTTYDPRNRIVGVIDFTKNSMNSFVPVSSMAIGVLFDAAALLHGAGNLASRWEISLPKQSSYSAAVAPDGTVYAGYGDPGTNQGGLRASDHD
jgi:hypothetical protein